MLAATPGKEHALIAAAVNPGGRLVQLSLTEGCTPASRAFVGLWKLAYSLSPSACGGCHPLMWAVYWLPPVFNSPGGRWWCSLACRAN